VSATKIFLTIRWQDFEIGSLSTFCRNSTSTLVRVFDLIESRYELGDSRSKSGALQAGFAFVGHEIHGPLLGECLLQQA
jgi:hypothetical protein